MIALYSKQLKLITRKIVFYITYKYSQLYTIAMEKLLVPPVFCLFTLGAVVPAFAAMVHSSISN